MKASLWTADEEMKEHSKESETTRQETNFNCPWGVGKTKRWNDQMMVVARVSWEMTGTGFPDKTAISGKPHAHNHAWL